MPHASGLTPRRILLTGSSGFVGRHLRAAAAERWPSTKVIGLSASAEPEPDMIAADLLDRAAVDAAVAAVQPDVIIHLAAQASIARGEQDYGATWAVNLGGTLNLALALLAHAPAATVLFASSAEVYGASFLCGPVDETTTLAPLNAYAKSKAQAERLLAEMVPAGARLVVARPFNHTGPGQQNHFVLPSFVDQVVRIETGLQPPQLAVGNIEVQRDFLDVRDVVGAYLDLVAASPRLPRHFTCNIASSQARPLRDHLETLRGLARRDFEIAVDPARVRAVDVPVASGCSHLLQSVTGWTPRFGMAQTLSEMIDMRRAECVPPGA